MKEMDVGELNGVFAETYTCKLKLLLTLNIEGTRGKKLLRTLGLSEEGVGKKGVIIARDLNQE